jgi:hypothetical protein
LVGSLEALSDLGSQGLLLGIGLVAAVRLDPFLDFGIPILYQANAFGILAVLVLDLIVGKSDFFGQVLNAVDPILQNQARIQRFGLRHPLHEIY